MLAVGRCRSGTNILSDVGQQIMQRGAAGSTKAGQGGIPDERMSHGHRAAALGDQFAVEQTLHGLGEVGYILVERESVNGAPTTPRWRLIPRGPTNGMRKRAGGVATR